MQAQAEQEQTQAEHEQARAILGISEKKIYTPTTGFWGLSTA